MNGTQKRGSRQAPAATRPTFAQMVALALDKAESNLSRLVEIRCADEHWNHEDMDVDYAVELALAHIRGMRVKPFNDASDFCCAWEQAGGVINLGFRAFSRPDCRYARELVGTVAMFEQIADLVEFAA